MYLMKITFMERQELKTLSKDEKCLFCRQNVVDELKYGKVYKYAGIIVHYFCMLFSSQMEQKGQDDEGILGFLLEDIHKEISRGTKLLCSYCNHGGATIACYYKSCKKKFHYPCAIQNGSLHLFYDHYNSFCSAHRKTQYVPSANCILDEKLICVMCQDEVEPKPTYSTIWAPCCKISWFHRSCVQKMSISAGYFFKCPNCNNQDIFRDEMLKCGIYIPDQDASWELEPNAFSELNERYNMCDAKECKCFHGRSYSTLEGDWEIALCQYCGSQGIHRRCANKKLSRDFKWICSLCTDVTCKHLDTKNVTAISAGPSEITNSKLRNRRRGRRRKHSLIKENNNTSLKENDDSPPEKLPPKEISNETSNNVSRLVGNGGETIEVVLVNSYQSFKEPIEIGGINTEAQIVCLSDDEDINKSDTSSSNNYENSESNITSKVNNETLTSPKQTNSNNVSEEIIDLLEDSDDESNKTLAKLKKVNDNDDDDVIFVGSDKPQKQENITSALIRIVENNTVFLVSPADIKKRGSIEAIKSIVTSAALSGINVVPQTNYRLVGNDCNANQNVVWQSIPFNRSIINALHQNQSKTPSTQPSTNIPTSVPRNNNLTNLPTLSNSYINSHDMRNLQLPNSNDNIVGTKNSLPQSNHFHRTDPKIIETINLD